jgi:hypothetical protein
MSVMESARTHVGTIRIFVQVVIKIAVINDFRLLNEEGFHGVVRALGLI